MPDPPISPAVQLTRAKAEWCPREQGVVTMVTGVRSGPRWQHGAGVDRRCDGCYTGLCGAWKVPGQGLANPPISVVVT